MSQPSYTIAVRALCEFTAKQGDLDLRFTPAPTAQEGIAGHALVTSRRPAGYERELALSGGFETLQVRGRADGFDPAALRLEEVKTFKGRLEAMPANHRALHWAQVQVYGALLCAERGLAGLELALVYFDIQRQTETVLRARHSAAELQALFEAHCRRFLDWAAQETAHRSARDAALLVLAFPHAGFRAGQRPLAEAVYKVAMAGRCLLAQAPTGIGKTVATLFPLLRAAPKQQIDKLYFLAAKTSGRAAALQALALLRGGPGAGRADAAEPERAHAVAAGHRIIPLRVLELVARDKACEHPELACHGESCPLAQGFYDRLPAARAGAVQAAQGGLLTQARLREQALAQQVCPYYLSQELVRWADVVVGDYNYYFDTSALLHGLSQAQGWRVAVLVDEAHNLVERGRRMYSATLERERLRAARRSAPAELKRPLERLQRQWTALERAQPADYQVLDELPGAWLNALQQAAAAIGDFQTEHPTHVDIALQAFLFDALQFQRMAESFGTHSLCDLSRAEGATGLRGPHQDTTLCLRNVLPAPFLQPRLAAAHCVILFSATLAPQRFQTELLGLPAGSAWIDVDSPFCAAQLQVRVARHLSTRFRHRARSLPALVTLLAAQFAERPGNYLAFFSSHDYLQQAADAFAVAQPQVPLWRQGRRMSEAEQRDFLERFREGGQGIGFAVLGGSFAEGVDLPGERLIGAFIATLGLPQVNPVNEQMRLRLDELLGAGYDYTYVVPGLHKVVQAAGRVIRRISDNGVLHLMDDRFAQPEVQAVLPRWWHLE